MKHTPLTILSVLALALVGCGTTEAEEEPQSREEAQFSFTADSEPDATGNSATLPMAHLVYKHDTIQAINDDTVTTLNVWDAADDGGKSIVCKRAED